MARQNAAFLVILVGVIGLGFTGCKQQAADLNLKFSPEQSGTYTVMNRTLKDYEFVQPSANKEDKKQTGVITEMTFDRQITSVDEAGNATARITIRKLKYLIKGKDGNELDFDSTNPDSQSDGLMGLIGAEYTITIKPDGKASLASAGTALQQISDAQARKYAGQLLAAKAVEERHSVDGLPEEPSGMKVGSTWNVEEDSPAGMLAKKRYDKTYTFDKVVKMDGSEVAVITMDVDTGAAQRTGSGQMGFFENMFDTREVYTGEIRLDMNSGDVLDYHQFLEATYIAIEPSQEKSEKGPDTLTMGFTKEIKLEKVD